MTQTQDALFDVFSRRYLAHAGSQLPGRASRALTLLARDALDFGRTRMPDEKLVRIADVDGSTTAIDIVTADAPYLVDSVRAELDRQGHPVERILHPQLVVTRDDAGQLTSIADIDDNAEVPKDAFVESWMYVELDTIDSARQAELAAALHKVLDDVFDAVSDAPEMYQLVRDLADELEANPGQFDRETSTEAAELLPAFRSGAPLVIFKSPLVSRVRRSAHYDCVTVVTPAGSTEGQTVHVFLGLIITGEDGAVRAVPVVRKRIAEILLRSGVRANSHTGRVYGAFRQWPSAPVILKPSTHGLISAVAALFR